MPTCSVYSVLAFTNFIERFRRGPNQFYTPPEPKRRRADRPSSNPSEPTAHPAPSCLKPADIEYSGNTAVTSYINRLEYIAQTYGEEAVLALLPTTMKDEA